MKNVLSKHKQPENCSNMSVPRANQEIWTPLDAFKRKADLSLTNMQQALQKAIFAIAKVCSEISCDGNGKSQDRKEIMSSSVDAE